MISNIYTQQFLQYAANAKYTEVEKLLKADTETAQQLLTANGIPFTDYSGRTFTCTVYEYSVWSKNPWMCALLEKFMNNETAKTVLERVLKSKELIGDGLFKRPRGLNYIQNNKECNSSSFDMNPLKKALKDFIDKDAEIKKEIHWQSDSTRLFTYAPKRDQTPEDLQNLKKLLMQIGLVQREMPSSIVQIYCAMECSLRDLSKDPSRLDNPDLVNMAKNIKVWNYLNLKNVPWFDNPDLGYSFALLSGDIGTEVVTVDYIASLTVGRAEMDLSAIEIIEVKINQMIEKSLENMQNRQMLNSCPVSNGQ